MAWTPTIAVIDDRFFAKNALDYIAANQRDALTWANGGSSALKVFKSLFLSPRLVQVFPSLTVIGQEHQTAVSPEETLQIDFSLTLEGAIQHGKEEYLAENSPKYNLAIQSMLANIPKTTLTQNSIITLEAVIFDQQTSYFPLAETRSQFLQVFQTRTTWRMESSIYT